MLVVQIVLDVCVWWPQLIFDCINNAFVLHPHLIQSDDIVFIFALGAEQSQLLSGREYDIARVSIFHLEALCFYADW